jgi:hypothetical protein
MQALVYIAPNRVELHDVARPAAQDGSVRLRVDAVGIGRVGAAKILLRPRGITP